MRRPHPQRQAGRQGQGIGPWISATMAWVKPRGIFGGRSCVCQVPERPQVLFPQFGGCVLKPLLGKAGNRRQSDALFARQGSRSDFILCEPLIIRDGIGRLTL